MLDQQEIMLGALLPYPECQAKLIESRRVAWINLGVSVLMS